MELAADKPEVLLEVVQTCIADVNTGDMSVSLTSLPKKVMYKESLSPIQETQEVCEHHERNEMQIQLAHQLFLVNA